MDQGLQPSTSFLDLEKFISRMGSFNFQLMHRDVVVAETVGNNFNNWVIRHKSLMPLGMRLYNIEEVIQSAITKYQTGCTERELGELVEQYKDHARDFNTNTVQNWLSDRVIPLSRGNAKLLYQHLGLEQLQSKHNAASIAVRFHAVSVTDNYWLKRSTEEVKHKDVDVRQIPLNETLGLFALTGHSDFTLDSVSDIQAAAETGLIGSYSKGCLRKDGKLFIVKGGSRHDVVAEWLSSMILGCTDIFGYCKYFLDDGTGANGFKSTGMLTTYCEIMSNLERDLIMAFTVENPLEIALSRFEHQVAQIAVWDYISGNTDRHGGNWGFFREAPCWDITGLHSVYDNNKTFGVATYNPRGRHLMGSIIGRGTPNAKTLEQGALAYKDKAPLQFHKTINLGWFRELGDNWENYVTEFKARCDVMGIVVQII